MTVLSLVLTRETFQITAHIGWVVYGVTCLFVAFSPVARRVLPRFLLRRRGVYLLNFGESWEAAFADRWGLRTSPEPVAVKLLRKKYPKAKVLVAEDRRLILVVSKHDSDPEYEVCFERDVMVMPVPRTEPYFERSGPFVYLVRAKDELDAFMQVERVRLTSFDYKGIKSLGTRPF